MYLSKHFLLLLQSLGYVKLFDYFSNQADISIQNKFKHNIYSYIPSGKASFKDIVVVWVVISVIHGPTSA